GAELAQSIGLAGGPGHPGHLVALGQEERDEPGADDAGRPGEEDPHGAGWYSQVGAPRVPREPRSCAVAAQSALDRRGARSGARGGTRTPTPLRAPDPKSGASPGSATLALSVVAGQGQCSCSDPPPSNPFVQPFAAICSHQLPKMAPVTRSTASRCIAGTTWE